MYMYIYINVSSSANVALIECLALPLYPVRRVVIGASNVLAVVLHFTFFFIVFTVVSVHISVF